MSDLAKGILTAVLSAIVPTATCALILLAAGASGDLYWIVALVGGLGLLYGLEAGILTIYDLGSLRGSVALAVDLTWSFLNTAFGFVIGNLVYIFFGTPSRADSKDAGWIVFKPRGRDGFGHDVLQTLGTVNLGGTGQHEKMHLLQARIFGPLYLPLFALFYLVTGTLQVLWTLTLGGILWLAKVRERPYFQPPSRSAVGGFFGWIYYCTPFELWAYAVGNP